MYEKLLISSGGGIVSAAQQADQENCATVAIGLGGTGVACLRTLKKEVFTRVKPDPDTVNSLVPKYSHIQFLAVDTDRSSIGDNGEVGSIDSKTEFFDISCSDISSLLGQAHLLKQDPSLHWLKAANTQSGGGGISILSAEAGAGGVRQVGRLLLLQSCTAFVNKLTNIINNALRGLPGTPSLNIHIFTGISGGTGAGTFLDVCYILQHVLGQLGLGGQAMTCGYFFLPDVHAAAGVTHGYIQLNGFASMKELDYAMNYSNNGGQWDQQYTGFRVTTNEPPVKLAHLVTAKDANGSIRMNGFDYAMHVVADYVLEYIIKPFVPDGQSHAGVFPIKHHLAGFKPLIAGVSKKHGACYEYSIIGASNAYLPYKEINTYLASKIFEGFSKINNRVPTEDDMTKFLLATSLKYADIYNALARQSGDIPMFDVDKKTLCEQVEGMSPDAIPNILVQMRDAVPKISGKLTENANSMLNTDAQPAVGQGEMIVALTTRVKVALMEIAADPEKGPYYAAAVLRSQNGNDLINIVQGYRRQTQGELNLANGDLEMRDQAIADTLRELQNCNFLNRSGRADNYVHAVHSYFMQRAKINKLTALGNLLRKFEEQLMALYESFFKVFSEVMTELQSTFNANLTTLSEPLAEDTSYAMKIMSLQELKPNLDASVEAMNINNQINMFITNMLNTPEIWTGRDPNKIGAAVSSHFLSELSKYTNMTIIDYLRIKYNTENPQIIQQGVYNDVILPLDSKAAPMFWLNNSVFKLTDAETLSYLSIPCISNEIQAAANVYAAAHPQVKVRSAWAQDRITIFNMRCGIPMYAYKGVENYRNAYRGDGVRNVGSHLYEGSDLDSRDSRKMVDIAPLSVVDPQMHTEDERKGDELYQHAKNAKMIAEQVVGSGTVYKICILDDTVIAARKQAAERILSSGNVAEAKNLLDNIQNNPLPVKSYRDIPNNGDPNYADQVVKDHVVDSQQYMLLIEEQLRAYEDMERTIAALRELCRKIDSFNNDMSTFSKALVTGVIERSDSYTYAYIRESFGIKETITLTTVNSEPYGMTLQIYSAFIGFQKLDEATKTEIATAVRNRLTNDEAVNAALSFVQQNILNDAKMNVYAQTAMTSYPEKSSEIISFLKRLYQDVTAFAAAR